ncbi:MAG: hypothetical protein AB1757_25050 [Acidobacteriota bacterium]
MTYAGTLAIHDADSHFMETPNRLHEFADPQIRERIDPQYFFNAIGDHRLPSFIDQRADADYHSQGQPATIVAGDLIYNRKGDSYALDKTRDVSFIHSRGRRDTGCARRCRY